MEDSSSGAGGGLFEAAQARASRIGWTLTAMLVTIQLFGTLLVNGLLWIIPQLANEPWFLSIMSLILPMVTGYPLYFLFMRRIENVGIPAQRRRMPVSHFICTLLIAFGVSYVINFFTLLFSEALDSITGRTPYNPLMDLTGALPWPVLLFLVAVAAPFFEEMVFRGVLLQKLRGYGERFSVVASALVFALFHGNLAQLFYTFIVGLILGYVAVKYGTVRYSIALHMLLNLPGVLALALMGDLKQTQQLIVQGDIAAMLPTLLLSLFVLLSVVAGLSLLVFLRKSIHLPESGGMPVREKYQSFFLSTGVAVYVSLCALLIVYTILRG